MTLEDLQAEFAGTSKSNNLFLPDYKRLADQIGPAGHVLEIGVQGGNSLRLWQRLFPEGLVAGADNGTEPDPAWPDGTVKFFLDQDDPELAKLAEKASPDGYDLIVDDASHVGELTAATLRMLWPLVKPGKWYVIEDWYVGYLPSHVDGWNGHYGTSMLRLAESLLPFVGGYPPGHGWGEYPSEVEVIEYRLGLIIIRKRENPW